MVDMVWQGAAEWAWLKWTDLAHVVACLMVGHSLPPRGITMVLRTATRTEKELEGGTSVDTFLYRL